jgi:hypothetical protein
VRLCTTEVPFSLVDSQTSPASALEKKGSNILSRVIGHFFNVRNGFSCMHKTVLHTFSLFDIEILI